MSIISEATQKNKKTNKPSGGKPDSTQPPDNTADKNSSATSGATIRETDSQTVNTDFADELGQNRNTASADKLAQYGDTNSADELTQNGDTKPTDDGQEHEDNAGMADNKLEQADTQVIEQPKSAAPPTFVNDFDDPAIPLDILDSPVHEHLTLREWIQLREAQRQQRRDAEAQKTATGAAKPVDTEEQRAETAESGETPSAPIADSSKDFQLARRGTTTPNVSKQPPSASAPSLATSATTATNDTAAPKASRDFSFDNIRAVLIFLVIFGHAIEYFRLADPVAEFVYVFIYFFHMPVFIFISGYFSKNLTRGRETAVRNFLLPYLLLNVVLTLIMLALGKIDEFAILNPGWTLWYLYCMFIWRLLLPDLVRVRHVLVVSLLVAIFSGFLTEFGTYMAMARTLGFLPFFLAGYFCQPRHIEGIRNFPFRRVISVVVAGVGLLTAALWSVADLPPEILWGDRAYDLIDIPLWQSLLADIFLCCLSFAFIFVFITLAKNRRRFYTIWGQNTLAIYLLHVYLVAPLVEAGERLAASGFGATGNWFGTPALEFLLLLVGSVLTLWLLSRPIVSRGVAKGLDKVTGIVMRR